MQIFTDLAKVGPQYGGQEEKDDLAEYMPFYAAEPHPGLRTYPFLSQARLPFMQTQTFALIGACTDGIVKENSLFGGLGAKHSALVHLVVSASCPWR